MRCHPAIHRRAVLGVLSTLLVFLAAIPAANASKAVVGIFGAPAGEGAGLVDEPKGIAVNTTGAGGVSPGDVYVVDSLNNRIDEFSAAGAFVRAFGYDVVASGPDNTGANEKQRVTVDATGGTFAVEVTRRTRAAIVEGSNTVTHVYSPMSSFHVGDVVGGFFPAGTTITAVGTESLVLSAGANITAPSAEFNVSETSSAIPYNVTAGGLQAALEAMPAIGAGNIAVTGTDAIGGLEVEYGGPFSHDDILPTPIGNEGGVGGGIIRTNSTGLTGGATHTATIAATVRGGGYEICDASGPNDVCKAGPPCGLLASEAGEGEVCQESDAAGSLDDAEGIAIDQDNGNIYVTDVSPTGGTTGGKNNRIDVYSATGSFEGAFGWDVDASSPKEELQFCTTATGCKFGTRGTGGGQLNVLPESLPALGPNGHLYVPDGSLSGAGNNRVDEFAPVLNVAHEITGVSFVGALGWDVVASGPDQADEIQKVTVRAATGKFKLAFKSIVTGELAFNAPARETEEVAGGLESVEKALNGLSSISSGGGSVTVTGGPGSTSGSAPYTITFDGGPLAHVDVAQIVGTKVGLSGGSPSTVLSVETYSNGTEGLEYCVVARGDVCKVGGTGPHFESEKLRLGEFSEEGIGSVAADQNGALYAINESDNFPSRGPARVYKFTFPGPGEVAAQEFAPEYLTEAVGDPSAVDPTSVAVDPATDHVLVAKKVGREAITILEFDSAGVFLGASPAGETGLTMFGEGGLAVGTAGRFYYSNGLGMVDVFGPPPAPTVSVAPATNIGSGSATFHGTVTPPVPVAGTGFQTTYHFEYSLDGVQWSRFPAEDVDVGDGSGSGPPGTCPVNNPPSCIVEQTVTGLVPNSHYLVRLVASTGAEAVSGTESFTTEPGAPLVSESSVEELAETSVNLTGTIDPTNEATSYHFEWGADTNYGNRVPVGADGSAGAGGQPVSVSARLESLKAGTLYHFRLVATNPSGTTDGVDGEFSTLDRYGLPDARVPEQVTPNDKRPVGMVAQLFERDITFQASSDGNKIIYPLLNGAADATAGGNVDYVGVRGESGWLSAQLTPPSLVPAVDNGVGEDATGHVLYASADLSCQIIESYEPLTADTPAEDVADGVHSLYRRSVDGTYTLLTAPVPLNPGGGSFEVDWASADCSHILFESTYRYLEEAAVGRSLYEWTEGALRVAGVVTDEISPGGEHVSPEAQAGLGGDGLAAAKTRWNSMSSDGSKVFFSAISNAGKDKGHLAVFERENGTSTVDVSQSQTATTTGNANYATATPDGTHVFFIANYGLANNATSTGVSTCDGGASFASGVGCDLYDYDTVTETLTDTSADANPSDADGASVVGLLDTSDDGSYVYFAARGQLVAGEGKTEAQNLEGNRTYNVYLNHNGSLSYVGLVTDADTDAASKEGMSGSDVTVPFSHWVADATPDGKHLLFVSKANVTGYDSKGVTEAYEYSAVSGETECLSCRPDGLPSVGDSKTEPITIDPVPPNGELPLPSVLDRPRSISDDGRRVVFTMPDVLAAGAKSHTRNIYEWEAGRLYLLVAGEEVEHDPTRYADMSTSGNDVFVATKAKLVAQDFDNTTDVYDLRVNGGFPEPGPPPPPCEPLADRCQGEAAPRLFEPPGPASEAFSGPGNPATVVLPCRKGLVLAHGKCVSKKPVVKRKKTVSKRCGKGHVRKHGKCVKKASVSHKARPVVNNGRAGR